MITIPLDVDKYTLITINDITRMFVIQIVAQVLFSIKNDSDLMTGIFIENTLFLLLGVFIYWMVFNYFVKFTINSSNTNNSDINNSDYYQSLYTFKDNN